MFYLTNNIESNDKWHCSNWDPMVTLKCHYFDINVILFIYHHMSLAIFSIAKISFNLTSLITHNLRFLIKIFPFSHLFSVRSYVTENFVLVSEFNFFYSFDFIHDKT